MPVKRRGDPPPLGYLCERCRVVRGTQFVDNQWLCEICARLYLMELELCG